MKKSPLKERKVVDIVWLNKLYLGRGHLKKGK